MDEVLFIISNYEIFLCLSAAVEERRRTISFSWTINNKRRHNWIIKLFKRESLLRSFLTWLFFLLLFALTVWDYEQVLYKLFEDVCETRFRTCRSRLLCSIASIDANTFFDAPTGNAVCSILAFSDTLHEL